MNPLFIVGAIGAVVKGIGSILGGASQADAANENAKIKREQADELLAREEINAEIIRDQARKEKGVLLSQLAGMGGGGSGIGLQLELDRNLALTLSNNRRDAEFKAKMLRRGADIDTKLASDYMTSGIISGVGTVLTGAASSYLDYKKYFDKTPSKGLP
jgi:hypothetical protein